MMKIDIATVHAPCYDESSRRCVNAAANYRWESQKKVNRYISKLKWGKITKNHTHAYTWRWENVWVMYDDLIHTNFTSHPTRHCMDD